MYYRSFRRESFLSLLLFRSAEAVIVEIIISYLCKKIQYLFDIFIIHKAAAINNAPLSFWTVERISFAKSNFHYFILYRQDSRA